MRHNLIEARKKVSLTQAQIAERLEICTRQYQRIELGEQDGTIKTWQKIKDLLGGTIDFLIVND